MPTHSKRLDPAGAPVRLASHARAAAKRIIDGVSIARAARDGSVAAGPVLRRPRPDGCGCVFQQQTVSAFEKVFTARGDIK
jgi:hypothetical protein